MSSFISSIDATFSKAVVAFIGLLKGLTEKIRVCNTISVYNFVTHLHQ